MSDVLQVLTEIPEHLLDSPDVIDVHAYEALEACVRAAYGRGWGTFTVSVDIDLPHVSVSAREANRDG